jgi:multiple antibiotic resistance protein
MNDAQQITLFSMALTFFIISNPIGNTPAIAAILKDFPFDRQKMIMLRESFFALAIALLFQFVGDRFLRLLDIKEYTVSIAGGILLIIVGLQMIFPKKPVKVEALKQEPYLVPIATPLITGGGLMSSIMLFSSLANDWVLVSGAILLAWVAVIPIMLSAPYIQRIMGDRGLAVLAQLMGMLLILMSAQLVVNGFALFMKVIK